MTSQLVHAAALAALVLLPAAIVVRRAAEAEPNGSCEYPDCSHCDALFGTPAPRRGEAGEQA
ncbi:hypothetical protein [Streptomyces sp. AD55]|uniref:hypothetical protein n=1 Tax=Streptomyces sp. AD55 TaxID=3242895 RepID=UPI003529B655